MEIKKIPITKITNGERTVIEDLVAVEEKYTVSINGTEEFSFTCSPIDLNEMVTGTLYSRKYIGSADQIVSLKMEENQVLVTLKEEEGSKEAFTEKVVLNEGMIFKTVNRIYSDPDTLFNRTGCAHSCSLMYQGDIICTFEDIGRHNALDKVIGYALMNYVSMKECVIFTSGRISGDYMDKIIHAGISVAVSRAAVTSEAVHLAEKHGVVLYGFVRGNSANRYN